MNQQALAAYQGPRADAKLNTLADDIAKVKPPTVASLIERAVDELTKHMDIDQRRDACAAFTDLATAKSMAKSQRDEAAIMALALHRFRAKAHEAGGVGHMHTHDVADWWSVNGLPALINWQGESALEPTRIVVWVEGGMADVDASTIPEGVIVEVRDYDVCDDGSGYDEDGNLEEGYGEHDGKAYQIDEHTRR